jgi:hypothetical protein
MHCVTRLICYCMDGRRYGSYIDVGTPMARSPTAVGVGRPASFNISTSCFAAVATHPLWRMNYLEEGAPLLVREEWLWFAVKHSRHA